MFLPATWSWTSRSKQPSPCASAATRASRKQLSPVVAARRLSGRARPGASTSTNWLGPSRYAERLWYCVSQQAGGRRLERAPGEIQLTHVPAPGLPGGAAEEPAVAAALAPWKAVKSSYSGRVRMKKTRAVDHHEVLGLLVLLRGKELLAGHAHHLEREPSRIRMLSDWTRVSPLEKRSQASYVPRRARRGRGAASAPARRRRSGPCTQPWAFECTSRVKGRPCLRARRRSWPRRRPRCERCRPPRRATPDALLGGPGLAQLRGRATGPGRPRWRPARVRSGGASVSWPRSLVSGCRSRAARVRAASADPRGSSGTRRSPADRRDRGPGR